LHWVPKQTFRDVTEAGFYRPDALPITHPSVTALKELKSADDNQVKSPTGISTCPDPPVDSKWKVCSPFMLAL